MSPFGKGIVAVLLSLAPFVCAQDYKVTNHWKVGGTGGWDYMLSDDAAHRLYIAHNARVEVLDTTSGKVVGAVTGLKSTHGVALDPDGKTGYISDGAGNAIVVFNRSDLSVITKVTAGTNPDGITYEPTTRTVWAFNGRSNNVSVMETGGNTIKSTIALPGKPEFPQPDGQGNVFVNIEDKNEIVKLSATDLKVLDTWSLAGCESPSGMAIDRSGHRLFSVCDGGKMAVTNYDTGKVIALASIGQGPDAAFYDAQRKLAFSSNGGDGTLTVVDASKTSFPTVQSVQTAKRARTMAYNVARGEAYLCTATFEAAAGGGRPATVPDSFEVLVVSK
jgi:DNA-binding beta-propeller fold protein YncE